MNVNRQMSTVKCAALLFFLLFFIAGAASAQTKLEVGIPGGPAAGQSVSGPVEYIKYIYLFTLGFVGIAGFISLVMWGTVWTASGVIDKKAAALDGIKNALTGIAIAFTAFIILNTINPDLTIIKAPTIGKVNITPAITPVVGPWFCRLSQPSGHDFERASQSDPGCGTPPFMNCGGEIPLCFIKIPNFELRPFWNCGTTVTPPLSTRWAVSGDQVPCASITRPYCSGLPLVCYAMD